MSFLDTETTEKLQFLDPENVEMVHKVSEIVEMVQFLDPEIVEMVDKSYLKSL